MLPKLKDLKKARLSMSQEISIISKMIIDKLKIILFLLMVGLLVVILNSRNLHLASVRSSAMDSIANLYNILNVPENFLSQLSKVKYFFEMKNKTPELITENEQLKQKITFLENMVKETEQLRILMNVVDKSIYSPITARVVSESYKNGESKFLVNTGSDNEVTEGMAVINQDGFIGRVIEVNKQSARVMTIQDEQSSIPAIAKPSNKRLIISGSSGLTANILIKYVDGGAVMPNEVVQTFNNGYLLPSGINIGFISEDGKSVVPNFKLENLDYVLVLKLKN